MRDNNFNEIRTQMSEQPQQKNENFADHVDTIAFKMRDGIKNWWKRTNDAKAIRRKIRQNEPTVQQRLKDAFIFAVIFGLSFLFMLAESISNYKAGDTVMWLAYSVGTAVTFLLFGGSLMYREAIAESKAARLRFERQVQRAFDNFTENLGRLLRRLLVLAISVVAISVALQYVPGLENHVPLVAEASQQVIDIFNSLLEKAVAFFESHIA